MADRDSVIAVDLSLGYPTSDYPERSEIPRAEQFGKQLSNSNHKKTPHRYIDHIENQIEPTKEILKTNRQTDQRLTD